MRALLTVIALCFSSGVIAKASVYRNGVDLYFNGLHQEALVLLKQEAEKGRIESIAILGEAYFWGNGVEKNFEVAAQYYGVALDKGLEKWRDQILYNLSTIYEMGTKNTPPNRGRAIALWKQAASIGHTMSACRLGDAYHESNGVELNHSLAFGYYSDCVKSVEPRALAWLRLGNMYADGQGVAKNPKNAVRAFEEAGKAGDVAGYVNAAVIHYYGDEGVDVNYKQALALIELSKNHPAATHLLALARFYGHGVVQDLEKSVRLFSQAIKEGSEEAKSNIHLAVNALAQVEVLQGGTKVLADKEGRETLLHAIQGQKFRALSRDESWIEVYLHDSNQIGFIEISGISESGPEPKQEGLLEARTDEECRISCYQNICFKRYPDGREIQFTPEYVWNPFLGKYEHEKGTCSE